MNNNNPFEVATIFYIEGIITLATLPHVTCYCQHAKVPEAETHLIGSVNAAAVNAGSESRL